LIVHSIIHEHVLEKVFEIGFAAEAVEKVVAMIN
jgi:hypothetical protein